MGYLSMLLILTDFLQLDTNNENTKICGMAIIFNIAV
jgi:hypothetical protein